MQTLSAILPTYNEAGNIVPLIRAIMRQVPAGIHCEIIHVDDNSPDGTAARVQEAFQGDGRIKTICRKSARGLASAIKTGINQASGDQVLVMDTDFSHDPVEIPRMLHLAEVYDVISGSRFCAGGSMEDTAHYLASLVYNWLLRIILRTQIQDNLAGYFTMRSANLKRLPLEDIFFGYGDYFFRLLNHCQRAGYSVVEIPVHYTARTWGYSKSNFFKLLFSYSMAALKFRMDTLNPQLRSGSE